VPRARFPLAALPIAAARASSAANRLTFALTAALVAASSTACIASRSGALVFPARYDLAPVAMSRIDSGVSGMHMAGALSWASVSPDPDNRIDAAFGYQLERYPVPDAVAAGDTMERDAGATLSDAGHPSTSSTTRDADPGTSLHGPFIEIGYRIAGNHHTRVWLSGRGELLAQDIGGQSRSGLGAVLRLSGELFATTRGPSAMGAISLGPFIEVGARQLPSGNSAAVALAGMSLRLPLVAVK
jgi:hypothetical protein